MVDVGANRVLCQIFGGWLLVESPSTASPGSLFRRDTSASYQVVSAESGFDFRGDVSPSYLTAVAAQVEHDATMLDDARVGFMCFVESIVIHFHFVAKNVIVLQQARAA